MKNLELQEYLRRQMDGGKNDGMSVLSSAGKKHTGSQGLIGQMSVEEVRMNKQLLKEISKKKKEKQFDNSKMAGSNSKEFESGM